MNWLHALTVLSVARPGILWAGEIVYKHVNDPKGCLLCHSQGGGGQGVQGSHKGQSVTPGRLVMLDGTILKYSDSPKLCGQCHGPIYFDWQQGIHGKITKSKDHAGAIELHKFVCTQCHDPHHPKFRVMRAEPPPQRPKLGIQKKEAELEH